MSSMSSAILSAEDLQQVERLIKISIDKPLYPETFIPWAQDIGPDEWYMPERLISLYGLPVYDTLSPAQRRELSRLEVAQAMYTYCWSEGLFCIFMNRYIQDRPIADAERQFLLREIIEECRHQEMFARAIQRIDAQPIMPNRLVQRIAKWFAGHMSDAMLFVECVAIEMMADRYGEYIRQDITSYSVMRRVAQLHHIEEARHIIFTKAALRYYTKRIGFLRATWYSVCILITLRVFQNLYVRAEFFEQLGIPNPRQVRREALRQYQIRFAGDCLPSVLEFINSFGGFNSITRPLWRWILRIG